MVIDLFREFLDRTNVILSNITIRRTAIILNRNQYIGFPPPEFNATYGDTLELIYSLNNKEALFVIKKDRVTIKCYDLFEPDEYEVLEYLKKKEEL